MNYVTAIQNAIPSMDEVGSAFKDIMDPNRSIQREADRRRGMNIIMTAPDDARYNLIRP